MWDLLMGLNDPILAVKLCEQKLTAIAAHETGALLAVGNSAGNVYLVELTEALYSFDKTDRNDLTSVRKRAALSFRSKLVACVRNINLRETYNTLLHIVQFPNTSQIFAS